MGNRDEVIAQAVGAIENASGDTVICLVMRDAWGTVYVVTPESTRLPTIRLLASVDWRTARDNVEAENDERN